MSVQELGSIGEFVSAIAVIVTLVYLSIQTRLTRKAAEETANFQAQLAARSVVDLYSHWRSLMANPELVEVLVKAKITEQLTDKEKILFSAVFEELFWTAASAFQSAYGPSATSGHAESVDVAHLVKVLKEHPRAIEDWHRARPLLAMFTSEFVESVDGRLATRGET